MDAELKDEQLQVSYPEINTILSEHFCCDQDGITVVKRFGEGRSGDVVMLINIANPADLSVIGYYVLKIASNTHTEFEHEIRNTRKVNQKTKTGRIITPELRFSHHLQPAFYVYDYVGNELIDSSSLSDVPPGKRPSRLTELCDELLSSWNSNCTVTTKRLSVRSLLYDWLEERRLSQQSRLSQRLRILLGDDLTPYFRYGDWAYPNPLYFVLKENGEWADDAATIANCLCGQMHGDLNANNVIVQPEPSYRAYNYYLIDFEHYSPSAPLFFDQAYLMLSILLGETVTLNLIDWCQQTQSFFDEFYDQAGTGTRSGQRDTLHAVQSSISAFIQRQQEHNRKSAQMQWLAANVAVGMNFVNKSSSTTSQQVFALLYAAAAAKTLLRALGHKMPDVAKLNSLNAVQSPGMAEIWRTLGEFSTDRRYLLMTSCLKSEYPQDTLLNLARVRWCSVIEINHLISNPMRDGALPYYKQQQGYRIVPIPEHDHSKTAEAAPSWFPIHMPENQVNVGLYYNRNIRNVFANSMRSVLSIGEKEQLVILMDPARIDPGICHKILEDIIEAAGENTSIQIACLNNFPVELTPDSSIHITPIDCTLRELSDNVYACIDGGRNEDDIRIPGKDGFVRIPATMAANLSNEITLIHRNITRDVRDDDGKAFFLGNEATWHDMANRRDILRRDYEQQWRKWLTDKLESMRMGSTVIVNLNHLPGGGGTTLAKRIAWDLNVSYPTMWLNGISDQTTERLKMVYDVCVKPLLVIAETSEGKITLDKIGTLRRSLLSKGVRVLFLCISRTSKRRSYVNENMLYLPDTPDMRMSNEEAEIMLRCFQSKLDDSQPDDAERILALDDLTHQDTNRSLRHPFFYGLFTFGSNYRGLPGYVSHNLEDRDDAERRALSAMAIITAYSQSVNFTLADISLFMYPGTTPDNVKGDIEQWVATNPLIARREKGYRINHPMVAEEVMRQCALGVEGGGKVELIRFLADFIDTLVAFYETTSERLNDIFRELFTHREVINDEELSKFSRLLTALGARDQCVEIMSHLKNAMPHNPHYANHLARVYLYPVIYNQKGVFPDLDNALKYAKEAIDLAETANDGSLPIHYHTLGKVYTQHCISSIKRTRKNIHVAIRDMQPDYRRAMSAFDMSIHNKQPAYGLTGKLELIAGVLNAMKDNHHVTVSRAMTSGTSATPELGSMMAMAGDLITEYLDLFGSASGAFEWACVRYFKCIGDIDRIETILNANATTAKARVETRRALATLYLYGCYARDREDREFSYDALPQGRLKSIFNLMDENIRKDLIGNRQDRIRRLETYRRMDSFSLQTAYGFVLDWPDAKDDLYVCYHRSIIAFLLYLKTSMLTYEEVRSHLEQCSILSRNAYGKNVTATLDYIGHCDERPDRDAFVRITPPSAVAVREGREAYYQQRRADCCDRFTGTVTSVHDAIVTFAISLPDNPHAVFLAKAPVSDAVSILSEGEQFRFYLGMSYSGLRVWDPVSLSKQVRADTLDSEND